MIILLGFPKSGTTSFHKLFIQLGYNSVHWRCDKGYVGTLIQKNKQMNVPLLTGLEKYNCITQMDVCISETECYWPQLIDYKQLYYENKDSIIILNKRCPKKLLSSFKRYNQLDKRLNTYNPELINNKTDNEFIQFIEKHYCHVETFFNSIPEAKFITCDIENDNVIEKLKRYLDVKNISTFPKENVNNNNNNNNNNMTQSYRKQFLIRQYGNKERHNGIIYIK
jgi:hypothetical protein